MVVRLRSLKYNDNGFNGTIMIFAPFFISIILVITFLPVETVENNSIMTVGNVWVDIPENYANMTWDERLSYVNDSHGGPYTEDIFWRDPYWWEYGIMVFTLGIGGIGVYLSDTLGNSMITWPDGTQVRQDDLEKYIQGHAYDIDWLNVVESIVTIDPPALRYIGPVGVLVRVLLIISVAIGLVEILWIG